MKELSAGWSPAHLREAPPSPEDSAEDSAGKPAGVGMGTKSTWAPGSESHTAPSWDALFVPLGYPGVISTCKVKSKETGNLSARSLQARGQTGGREPR